MGVDESWTHQRTPEDYLRKLMVEHFGMHIADIDYLWLGGLKPPLCEFETN